MMQYDEKLHRLIQQLFEAARNNRDTQPIIRELVWKTIGRIL